MGISSKLFQLMSKIPTSGELHELSDSELIESGLENVVIPSSIELLQVGKDGLGIKISRNTYDSQITTWVTCDRNQHPVFENRVVVSDKPTIESLKEWSMYGDMILKTENMEIPLKVLGLKIIDQVDGATIQIKHSAIETDVKKLVAEKKFSFEANEVNRYSGEAAWSLSFTLPKSFDGLRVLPRACAR